MVNSQKPRSEAQLRERHTEICPRISDPESECLACEFAQHLKHAKDRHVRYLGGIKTAIGDDRWKTDTGEPARSDKAEIGFMRRTLNEERLTVAEYEKVLRDHGYDFEGEADCIDWLRNMLASIRGAKEASKR